MRLTVLTTQAGGVPGVVAQDFVSTVHWGAVVRACVVGAERLATLGLRALAVVALDLVGVVDRSVFVRATDRVAVRILLLPGSETEKGRKTDRRSIPLSSTAARMTFKLHALGIPIP